ncbi:hypothetical protein MRS44_003778 [Fusarium solani]|uniref:uncharacterized protein n=1 Tax=Fusarium solani TaxID=169388 RepID=UPI0032C4479F|nr:hypothetical protein MRS44_003778 [Fusarium solani]
MRADGNNSKTGVDGEPTSLLSSKRKRPGSPEDPHGKRARVDGSPMPLSASNTPKIDVRTPGSQEAAPIPQGRPNMDGAPPRRQTDKCDKEGCRANGTFCGPRTEGPIHRARDATERLQAGILAPEETRFTLYVEGKKVEVVTSGTKVLIVAKSLTGEPMGMWEV